MFGWWRTWRRTVARRKAAETRKANKKRNRRPYQDNWDDTLRYADPVDGGF